MVTVWTGRLRFNPCTLHTRPMMPMHTYVATTDRRLSHGVCALYHVAVPRRHTSHRGGVYQVGVSRAYRVQVQIAFHPSGVRIGQCMIGLLGSSHRTEPQPRYGSRDVHARSAPVSSIRRIHSQPLASRDTTPPLRQAQTPEPLFRPFRWKSPPRSIDKSAHMGTGNKQQNGPPPKSRANTTTTKLNNPFIATDHRHHSTTPANNSPPSFSPSNPPLLTPPFK
ncbi:hypothetical protein BT67DRAFT_157985 [Trichocladium antarcticum]|uniref:Uncharacterized protein n=1 Tax=Trichocladium antarcticum TaxID=1450529 RepID=A0AAN6UGQ2_9PEZI|nr:hypothetical protein BT67DRAFT_157985 [Trichocladium antarcticum]